MHLRTMSRILSVAVLALLVSQAAPVRAADDDMATMVENAKTAADHERIAAMYDAKAAGAKKQAELHRKMEKSYSVSPPAGKGTPTALPQHCAALAKDYDNAAKEYATLAAAHRDMAKAVK